QAAFQAVQAAFQAVQAAFQAVLEAFQAVLEAFLVALVVRLGFRRSYFDLLHLLHGSNLSIFS
ncbi:MAG: hypothetical protein HOM85_01310, partial [Euryarchaeota archaeon]|nr:hypothetical protein [Euryarchaeota archaeon]